MKIARFVFQLFGINTYVVWNPTTLECGIVDPGMSSAQEEQALINFISKNGLKIKHLINTHLHVDHVAGNQFVMRQADVKPEAHAADLFLGQRVGQQAEEFGLPIKPDGVEIAVKLEDGDAIRFGGEELKVIHVPGHSPGSLALYDKEGGWLISGDALFRESIGRTDFPGGSMPQLKASIREKLFVLPDNTVVYPGHGEPTTIGHEKRYNYFVGF